jgi:magnesium-transporting ATPase (P-type)
MTAGPTFQTASELMKRLETSEEGLSSEEAARRAQACGPNEMTTVHVGRKVLEVIRSVLGSELEHMHDAALARVAEEVTVFARVSRSSPSSRSFTSVRHGFTPAGSSSRWQPRRWCCS